MSRRGVGADFEGWAAVRRPWLVAVLSVAAGDAEVGRQAADDALGRAGLGWRAGDDDERRLVVLRDGLNVARRLARRSVADASVPPGWDASSWAEVVGLPSNERVALALRIVGGLSQDEADAVNATVRSIDAGDVPDGLGLVLVDAPLPLVGRHERLALLSSTLCDVPPDAAALVGAARRRRTVQRSLVGAAVVVVLLVAALVVARFDTVDGQEARPASTTTTSAPIGVEAPAPDAVTVTPDRVLRDGQSVTMHIAEADVTYATVTQCAEPPVAFRQLRTRCDDTVQTVGIIQDGLVDVSVMRWIRPHDGGLIDCATEGSSCGLLVTTSTTRSTPATVTQLGRPFVALHFLPPDSPEQQRIILSAAHPIADGQRVIVRGTHFAPNEELTLALCAQRDRARLVCDVERDASVHTDARGRFDTRLLIYRDILTSDGWDDCTTAAHDGTPRTCLLSAYGPASGSSTLPLDLVPAHGVTGIRPHLVIEPSQYALGQAVRIRGTGFQVHGDVRIGTCPRPTGNALTDCTYPGGDPNTAFIQPDQDGRFVLPAFPLPTDAACAAAAGACVIGGHQADPVDFTVPLVFQG